jgi:hypothetical protein
MSSLSIRAESATIETVLTPPGAATGPPRECTVRSYGLLGLAYRQTTRRRRDVIHSTVDTPRPAGVPAALLPEKCPGCAVIDGQVVTRGPGTGPASSTPCATTSWVTTPVAIDWRGSARREHLVTKQWRASSANRECLVRARHRPHQAPERIAYPRGSCRERRPARVDR